jgi:ribose/xylose/arabinose/galactoside ABC-type transport system permease subunit
MTFVILTGGIDLSVGSVLALSTSITAMALTRFHGSGYGVHIAAAILAALACSTLAGASGAVIATVRVSLRRRCFDDRDPRFGQWLTGNANIDIGFGRDVAAAFAETFRQKSVVIGAYVALAAFGGPAHRVPAATCAIGDNETAAEYTGLPIRSVKLWVYSLSGLLSDSPACSTRPKIIRAIPTPGSPTSWTPSPRW